MPRAAIASLQIGLGLGDLGRLGGTVEIGQLVLGLLDEMGRLIDRGAVHRVVLVEQRRALGDAVAALDMDGGHKPLLGRADFDEVGLGVALPRRLGRRLPQPEDGERRGDGDDDAQHYDRSLVQDRFHTFATKRLRCIIGRSYA